MQIINSIANLGMEAKDVVSAWISIANIFTTIILTVVNSVFLVRNNRALKKTQAYSAYYIPLVRLLLPIQSEFAKAYAINKNFNIYDAAYAIDEELQIRYDIINIYYRDFLKKEAELPCCLFDEKVDVAILKARNHMHLLVSMLGQEGMINIEKEKEMNPQPDITALIDLISSQISKTSQHPNKRQRTRTSSI